MNAYSDDIRRKKATAKMFDALWGDDVDGFRVALREGADIAEWEPSSDTSSGLTAASVAVGTSALMDALEAGADPNQPNLDGSTALTLAARDRDFNALRLLISFGASVDDEFVEMAAEQSPDSSLHEAAQRGDEELVRALLPVCGKKIFNCLDYVHRTPLICAVDNRHFGVVKLLVEAGADLNAADESGYNETALVYAVQNSTGEILRYLIEHGANRSVTTSMNVPLGQIVSRSPDKDNVYWVLRHFGLRK